MTKSGVFDGAKLVHGGYGYGAEPTFLHSGGYGVVKTYHFSVKNVLNVKSKISAFQNIQIFGKRLSIEKVTKKLVLDCRDQK